MTFGAIVPIKPSPAGVATLPRHGDHCQSARRSVNGAYQYDAAGNMTHDANHIYFYDAENRTIQVDGTLGTARPLPPVTPTTPKVAEYKDRRFRGYQYVYDVDGQVIHEADGAGNFTAITSPSPASSSPNTRTPPPSSSTRPSGFYASCDRHDNPSTPVDTLDFLPFGEQLAGAPHHHQIHRPRTRLRIRLDNFRARFDSSTSDASCLRPRKRRRD